MTLYSELVADIRAVAHITTNEWDDNAAVSVINSAIRQINSLGMLIDIARTDITQAAATYLYDVPAGVLWVHHLEYEDAAEDGGEWVPPWAWDMQLATNPEFVFSKATFDLRDAKKIRVIGQAKAIIPPGANAAAKLGETVEPEIEDLLHTAILQNALSRVSQGQSQHALDRADQRREQVSFYDAALSAATAARVRPGSRRVPGR